MTIQQLEAGSQTEKSKVEEDDTDRGTDKTTGELENGDWSIELYFSY